MIDYNKLSDQEINQAIGKIVSLDGISIIASDGNAVIHEYADCGEFKGICLGWKVFDPCNNPADAWPIIVENKIWLREMYGIWDSKGFPDERHPFNQVGWKDKNPLRAAMIAFLMMQGEKIG